MTRFLLSLSLWLPLSLTNTHRSLPAQQNSEVVNDPFIASLLKQVSYQRLVAAKYPIMQETTKIGAGGLVRFTHGANQFTCFRSPHNTFTVSFAISRPEPVLAPLLVLGTAKREILRQLGVVQKLNTLQVTDLEGMAQATLVFREEKLAQVTFQATID